MYNGKKELIIMGMSAGQARLLSITSRLTDNELRSQMLTNTKLRLADKSSELSDKYMEALNSQQLVFSNYNANGDKTSELLTAGTIFTFSELKNQYSLVNSSGQVLVRASDIKNYMNSANMTEFLESYGVPKVENPEYTKALQNIYGANYENLYSDVLVDDGTGNMRDQWDVYFSQLTEDDIGSLDDADTDDIIDILNKDPMAMTEDDANKVLDTVKNWENSVVSDNNGLLEDYQTLKGSSLGNYIDKLLNPPSIPFPNIEDYMVTEGSDLSNKFSIASESCYINAIQGDILGCYIHVLAHLLDLKSSDIMENGDVGADWGQEYTTTLGNGTIKTSYHEINGSAINADDRSDDMAEVSEYVCADKDGDGKEDLMAPDSGLDITEKSADVEKLLSNYKIVNDNNGDGVVDVNDAELKTFKEKIIDLYYVMQHFNDPEMQKSDGTNYTYDELKVYLENFQTDMEGTLNKVKDEYYQDIANWQESMKQWLEQVQSLKSNYVNDVKNIPVKEIPDENDSKYLWYKNLWYRMGGIDESSKDPSGRNYKELDENLINNAEWLEFALEHGIVTLEQAQFEENGSTKYPNMGMYDWVSIIYTNASDITSQDDEAAIALAEVKYKKDLQELQNEDKKLDQDLKKLDTEHSALQTEYESVKNVIDKNVERSFKAFS